MYRTFMLLKYDHFYFLRPVNAFLIFNFRGDVSLTKTGLIIFKVYKQKSIFNVVDIQKPVHLPFW